MRRLVLAAAVVLLVLVGFTTWRGQARAASRTNPLAAGTPAPDVRLADQHGRPFSLAEVLQQRRFVVIAFYPKAFTSG